MLASKAYIFRDYAKGGTLAGREIQSINGVPSHSDHFHDARCPMKDGDVQTTRQRDISGDFGINLIVLLGLRAPYDVVLAAVGTNETGEGSGCRPEARDDLVKMSKMLFPQDKRKKKWAELKFLDNGQIARLTYSAFGGTWKRVRRS